MKPFLFNIPAILCYCIAAYMAVNDKEGWGWFLFVGLLINGTSVKTKKDETKVE